MVAPKTRAMTYYNDNYSYMNVSIQICMWFERTIAKFTVSHWQLLYSEYHVRTYLDRTQYIHTPSTSTALLEQEYGVWYITISRYSTVRARVDTGIYSIYCNLTYARTYLL